MAKFPTYEELGRQAAEYALDEYRYIGRTIREWIALITSTEDETGFDIGNVLMRLRSKDVMCEFCDNYFGEECEAGDVLECASWSAAQKAAELIEHLYAANCAKSAEISLLTRDRDEWKRRAEVAEYKIVNQAIEYKRALENVTVQRDGLEKRAAAAERDLEHVLHGGDECHICAGHKPECLWECDKAKWHGPKEEAKT